MESTAAIVTRLTRLTESSLIVHWFTEQHGLVKTVAKGALRPKSAFAGKLDLFFGGVINFAPSRGELHPLREVMIEDWREGLRRHYASTLLAGYCCQLLELAVEPAHAEPFLYDLLRRALDHIAGEGASLRALQYYESEVARHLGVGHDRRSAADALFEALGTLPATRKELIERFAGGSGG